MEGEGKQTKSGTRADPRREWEREDVDIALELRTHCRTSRFSFLIKLGLTCHHNKKKKNLKLKTRKTSWDFLRASGLKLTWLIGCLHSHCPGISRLTSHSENPRILILRFFAVGSILWGKEKDCLYPSFASLIFNSGSHFWWGDLELSWFQPHHDFSNLPVIRSWILQPQQFYFLYLLVEALCVEIISGDWEHLNWSALAPFHIGIKLICASTHRNLHLG